MTNRKCFLKTPRLSWKHLKMQQLFSVRSERKRKIKKWVKLTSFFAGYGIYSQSSSIERETGFSDIYKHGSLILCFWFQLSSCSPKQVFKSLAKDSRIHGFSSHACLMLRFLHNLSLILQRFVLCSKFRKHSVSGAILWLRTAEAALTPPPAALPQL